MLGREAELVLPSPQPLQAPGGHRRQGRGREGMAERWVSDTVQGARKLVEP